MKITVRTMATVWPPEPLLVLAPSALCPAASPDDGLQHVSAQSSGSTCKLLREGTTCSWNDVQV